MPSPELIQAMGRFNEEMVQAGVMKAGEGLRPSSKGARVRFSGGKTTVIDGPFAEVKELIAGFWIIEVGSKEQAVAWARKSPPPFENIECEIEVRQIFEAADFAGVMSPEEIAREEELRAQLEKKG